MQKQKLARRQGQRPKGTIDRNIATTSSNAVNTLKGYELLGPALNPPDGARATDSEQQAVSANPATIPHAVQRGHEPARPRPTFNPAGSEESKPLHNVLDKLARGGKRDRAAFEGDLGHTCSAATAHVIRGVSKLIIAYYSPPANNFPPLLCPCLHWACEVCT